MGSRKDILIHIGNTGYDSLGCLMPNKTYKTERFFNLVPTSHLPRKRCKKRVISCPFSLPCYRACESTA